MAEAQTNLPEVFATTEAASTVADTHGETHVVEPELLGLEPYQWVSVAMLVLLLIAFGGAKVHKIIAGGLDAKIKAIRDNLEEARQLRAEAEALRDEYAAKIAGAEKDAEAMLEHARREAESIIAKAEQDTAAIIARRERMATEKIAAAERQALAELKAKAADASTAAAAALIAAKLDAEADKAMVEEVIANL